MVIGIVFNYNIFLHNTNKIYKYSIYVCSISMYAKYTRLLCFSLLPMKHGTSEVDGPVRNDISFCWLGIDRASRFRNQNWKVFLHPKHLNNAANCKLHYYL